MLCRPGQQDQVGLTKTYVTRISVDASIICPGILPVKASTILQKYAKEKY